MQPYMSYRLVILNGEKRGERLDIGRAPLTIGRGPSCDIQLPDHQAEERHAQLASLPSGLQITALDQSHPLRVNKVSTCDSLLKHGDVIEIGATRLFIQSQREAETWKSLARWRPWRKGLTIGLPILILTSLALILNQYRHRPDPSPAPSPAPARTRSLAVADPNNTDWQVTNVARIVIHPAVSLASTPPEIAEAEDLFIKTRTNTTDQEIEAAHQILSFASEFLAEARKLNAQAQAIPESPLPATLLKEAERSMAITPAAAELSSPTNSPTITASEEASPNQAGSLKN